MSDLFCAATVIFSRHAEAEYVESWFSDEGGTLTPGGREQAAALGESLRGRRIARVWCSDSSRAVQTAEIAAARLGVAVVARKALREIDVGDLLGSPFDVDRIREVTRRWAAGELDLRFPGGESGHDVVRRFSGQLEEIADLHRGETVLVVGHESAGCVALRALAGRLDGTHPDPEGVDDLGLSHGQTVEVSIDADGVRLDRWGERIP